MFKKEYLYVFIIIGLAITYAVLAFLVLITRGKWAKAVKRKIAIGTLIVTFSAIMASGQTAYSWWPTPTPTAEPTLEPTQDPTLDPTIEPTPMCYTPTPSITMPPVITAEPTIEPTPMCYTTAPTITPTPEPQDPLPCEPDSTITADFAFDGNGEFCWEAASLGTYINSWCLEELSVNGVDFTNQYVHSSALPPSIDGKYYVVYKCTVPWGHFEAKN